MVDEYKTDANLLNEVAWTMVDPDHPYASPDLDVALTAATRANELSHGDDGGILDTLAHVYAAKGDNAQAFETEKNAVDKTTDAGLKKDLQKYLDTLSKKTEQK